MDKGTILSLLSSFDSEENTDLLHPIYRDISEALGMENAIEIYHLFAGLQVSFPVHFLHPEDVKRRIAKEFDGKNIRALAKKYGYSEKSIRRFLKTAPEE